MIAHVSIIIFLNYVRREVYCQFPSVTMPIMLNHMFFSHLTLFIYNTVKCTSVHCNYSVEGHCALHF